MKIHPVGAELFHVDRRTNMTKLVFPFHSFANMSKNGISNVILQDYEFDELLSKVKNNGMHLKFRISNK